MNPRLLNGNAYDDRRLSRLPWGLFRTRIIHHSINNLNNSNKGILVNSSSKDLDQDPDNKAVRLVNSRPTRNNWHSSNMR